MLHLFNAYAHILPVSDSTFDGMLFDVGMNVHSIIPFPPPCTLHMFEPSASSELGRFIVYSQADSGNMCYNNIISTIICHKMG